MSRRRVLVGVTAAAFAAVAWFWFATRRTSTNTATHAVAGAVHEGGWSVLVELGVARILSPPRRPTFVDERASLLSFMRAGELEIEQVAASPRRVALPPDTAPIAAGAPVVPVGGVIAVPLSRPSATTDVVLLVDASGATRTVDLPSGLRVVAARATTPPELLFTGPGDGESVAIIRMVLHDEGRVEERERSTVPYTPSLIADSSPDQRCGLEGERFFPLVARAPSGGVLVAVTDAHLYPLRFTRTAGATVTPVCGACPPMVVSRDGDDVSLLVTVGRKLAKSGAPTLPERPVRDASGACTSKRTVVAIAAGEGLFAASTPQEGGWKLGPAVRIAGPLPDGPPVEVRLVALGERLTVFFRSANAKHVERRTSIDGGATWR